MKHGPNAHGGGTGVRVFHAITDWAVTAAAYLGAAGLARWPGTLREELALLAGWGVVVAVGAGLRRRGYRWAPAVEIAGFGLLMVAANAGLMGSGLSAGQIAYATALVAVMLVGWRAWRDRSAGVAREPVAEPLRVLLVTAAALGVMLPMFTNHFVGGTDARWYSLMLHDFIEQWRASGPPVFLGQGEFVWVGAVHPFRSAPVYMHVAGLWDWLTWGALETEALQHLTAITAALASALGLYAAGTKLAEQPWRWPAAAVAVIYVLSAAVLSPLYFSDAYMTYMASAAFVWAFYGNARILADGRGWVSLAGGLSLAWMSHPPTAMQVTLLTAFLQTGGLVFRRAEVGDWARAAAGAALFALLSAYYFVGMSEIPSAARPGLRAELVQVLALLAGWAAAAQLVLMRRSRWWGPGLLAAGGALWFTCRPWALWLGGVVVLLVGVRAVAGRWKRFDPAGREPLVMLAALVLAGGLMDFALRAGPFAQSGYPATTSHWTVAWSAFRFDPLASVLRNVAPFEPGWGLWFGGVLAGIAALWRRSTAAQLLFAAVVLMSPFVMRWPWFGDFWVEFLPPELRLMTAAPMHLRTMPVLAALLATALIVAWRTPAFGHRRGVRWVLGGVLALATAWAVWQARVFVQRGWGATSSAELSAQNRRTENAPMDRFVYDLLPMPSYFSHGKMDPRLEARLLDDAGNLIYGPPQMVEAMEAAGSRTLQVDTFPVGHRTDWLQLEPRFSLEPGEHRLLRFEFNPSVRMEGYLLLQSERGYREYALPESGLRRAFGTGEENARVISLWNSGPQRENYQMQFAMLPGNELGPGMHFARVTLSAFQPGLSLIEVKALNPWRVETRLPWSGQLETPRVFLPGYEVRVDGRRLPPARVSVSRDRLLQIAMPPGEHTVEVRFVGTWRLRAAGLASLAGWLLVLGWMASRHRWPALRARF